MLKIRFMANDVVFYEQPGEGAAGGDPAPAGDPAAGGGAWFEQAGAAADHHEWLKTKQFADLNTQLASHRQLEQMVGRQRLAIPNDEKDEAAYNAIYKTLGRPDTGDGYTLAEGSKIATDDIGWLRQVAHENGISQKQFAALTGAYEKQALDAQAAAETEAGNMLAEQQANLKKEWGSKLEANEDLAARAWRALGIDEAVSTKLESVIGYDGFMKLFHQIGSGMGEAQLRQGEHGPGFSGGGTTLEAEKAKLDALFKDKEFMDRYQNHDPRVREPAIKQVEAIQIKIAELKRRG